MAGNNGVTGRLRQALKSGASGAGKQQERIAALERDVAELRQQSVRLAEIADVVQELLVPLASRDQARIDAALEKFSASI